MNPIVFECFVPMIPVPNKSAVVTRSGHSFKPKECVVASKIIAEEARKAYKGEFPLGGAVGMWIEFVMPRPKSRAKADFHLTRPDASNLNYLAENALKGIVYNDDSQVVANVSTKRYQIDDRDTTGLMIRVVDLSIDGSFVSILIDRQSLCGR